MRTGILGGVDGDGAGRWRVGALGLLAAGAALAAALVERVPQDPAYHAFADRRALGALANAADVLSNLGFVAAGLAGLAAVLTGAARFADRREAAPWLLFFGSVALVGPGSAAYHLAPTHATLVWDRLPMAAAFAALLVAALSERVGPRASRLLLPLVAASVGTVLYWRATELAGSGDLRPYAFAQFYPLAAIPLLLALFPERYTRTSLWVGGLALYGLAKLAEAGDARLFGALGAVSGHTLKHLLAAAGIGLLAWMLRARRPLQ